MLAYVGCLAGWHTGFITSALPDQFAERDRP